MFRFVPILSAALILLLAPPSPGLSQTVILDQTFSRPAGGEQLRYALVIGNSSYRSKPLRNPVHDAELVAETLHGLGFAVSLLADATQNEMKEAILRFGDVLDLAGDNAVGLFFFAGHGVQRGGANYLMPVDTDLAHEREVLVSGVPAQTVLSIMEAARNDTNIIILDACRNNPFPATTRSAGRRGLAEMRAPEGSLVAFSTGPGSVAQDGDGRHSPYALALTRQMTQPGVELSRLFKLVGRGVKQATGGEQTPWVQSSFTGDFYFKDAAPAETAVPVGQGAVGQGAVGQGAVGQGAGAPAPGLAPALAGTPSAPINKEVLFWQSIQDSDEPSLFQAYLEQYPSGSFAPLARAKVRTLQAARTPGLARGPAAGPTGADLLSLWEPKSGFDGRVGQIRVRNPSLYPIEVHLWHPDSKTRFETWSVPGQTTLLLDYQGQRLNIGSDWGLQIGGRKVPVRTVKDVTDWSSDRVWLASPEAFH